MLLDLMPMSPFQKDSLVQVGGAKRRCALSSLKDMNGEGPVLRRRAKW